MPKSKWKKTANEIAEYLEKAQENAETEKPGVDAMIKALKATKKVEKEPRRPIHLKVTRQVKSRWRTKC